MESKNDSVQEKEKVKEKEKKVSPPLDAFQKQLDQLQTIEEKIRFCLEAMKAALSHSKKPDFKGFWEARRLCLPLFKEPMHPVLRSDFWKEYIEMTEEARRLKAILEEQTSFTVEQITLAIDSLEQELTNIHLILPKIPNINLPQKCRSIEENKSYYNNTQRELVLYNSLASRLTSLRKELIDCEMRISLKNKLFKRLSSIGDKIFPKRKELIGNISHTFQEDVDGYVESFEKDAKSNKVPYFVLRDEIKHLQNVAKVLSLKTSSYISTRKKLSECWDVLKELDSKRKSEMQEREEETQQQCKEVEEKIEELDKKCKENIPLAEADKISDGIFELMKTLKLSRNDERILKKKMNDAKEPLFEVLRKEKEEKAKKVAAKKANIDKFISDIDLFVSENQSEDLAKWVEAKQKWEQEIPSYPFSSEEKEKLDRHLTVVDDCIFNKNEESQLSKDPSSEELQSLLDIRMEYRSQIKSNLKVHKKLVNEPRLSFGKSIFYQEQFEEEKERLQGCEEKIEALLEKLEE